MKYTKRQKGFIYFNLYCLRIRNLRYFSAQTVLNSENSFGLEEGRDYTN